VLELAANITSKILVLCQEFEQVKCRNFFV